MKAILSLISVLCICLSSCVQMEWRGGMVPHLGLQSPPAKDSSLLQTEANPLREITQDWSQFRGSKRDGHVPLPSAHKPFSELPNLRWKTSCGAGHSSIITSGSLIITLEQQGDSECLTARNMSDGSEIWEVSEPTRWDDMMSGEGPRSTPCLLYTSPSPRDGLLSRMPSSA